MNVVEIEEAVSPLAEQPFGSAEFPGAFLSTFGNKDTTIKKFRAGASKKSDFGGEANNVHIAVTAPVEVTKTLVVLRECKATARWKAKFVLATDGVELEAEDFGSSTTVACR